MKAETRAKELSRYVAAEVDAGGLDVGTLEALLLTAFHAAENDKLEEAAKVADPPLLHRKGSLGLWRIRRIEIAERIRALKSPA